MHQSVVQLLAGMQAAQPGLIRQPVPRCADAHRDKRQRRAVTAAASASGDAHKQVTLLDYGAGNVRSVRNALKRLGYAVKDVRPPDLHLLT